MQAPAGAVRENEHRPRRGRMQGFGVILASRRALSTRWGCLHKSGGHTGGGGGKSTGHRRPSFWQGVGEPGLRAQDRGCHRLVIDQATWLAKNDPPEVDPIRSTRRTLCGTSPGEGSVDADCVPAGYGRKLKTRAGSRPPVAVPPLPQRKPGVHVPPATPCNGRVRWLTPQSRAGLPLSVG